MLDTETFKDYVNLYKEKQDLEADLKDVVEKMSNIEPFLLDNLQANEMDKISIAGKTCYTLVNTFAVVKNRSEAIEVLRASGYEAFVKEGINIQSVSKLVRDLIEETGELPDTFGDVITKGTKSSLRVINA